MSFTKRHKFAIQLTAFLLVILPSVALIYSINAGIDAVTWRLLGLIVVGMGIALWGS